MENEEFEGYVVEAVSLLPNEFRDKLNNVAIVVEDYPSPYQQRRLKLRRDTMLLGLYEGVPQTQRFSYGMGMTLPDKITIFKRSILSMASTREEIIGIIKDTVYHEIAHHFGMSEKEISNSKARNKNPRIRIDK